MIRVEEFHKKTPPSGEGQKKPSDLLVISTITSLTEGFFVVHPKEVVKTLVALVFGKYKMHEMAAHFVSHLPTTNVSST